MAQSTRKGSGTRVILIAGIIILALGVVAVFMSNAYAWSAPINKHEPPAGASPTSTPNLPPPPSTTTQTVPPTTTTSASCSWDYSGTFTVRLLKNGKVLRKWDTQLSVFTDIFGKPNWSLAGEVTFNLETCGSTYAYAVEVYAIITKVADVGTTTTYPTNTSTWAPPNIQPPNHPPIVPLSVVGEKKTAALYVTNGVSEGSIKVSWHANIGKIIEDLGTGRYNVQVYAEVAYQAPGHEAIIYSSPINIGDFVFDGSVVGYAG